MIKAAFAVLAVSGVFAHGGDLQSDVVATVDGQAIEHREFDRWMTIAARSDGTGLAPPDPTTGYRKCIAAKRKAAPRKVSDKQLARLCEEDYERLRNQVMQLLLSFKWITGEAAAQGIVVTDAEVEQSFADQKRKSFPREADYQKFLRTSGQTQADILARVRLDLLSNKIRDKVVAGKNQISDGTLAEYYADNKARFAVPELRSLRVVVTKREAEAQQARAALERGTSWKAVARRYSIDDPSKHTGGLVRDVADGMLERRINKAVFSAAKQRLVGPIHTRQGYWVFRVSNVKPARQRPLAEVKKVIRDTLVSQARQAALDVFVRDFTARWKAKTECAEGYRTADCRNGPAATPDADPRGLAVEPGDLPNA
jgi:foldase protein PrsA